MQRGTVVVPTAGKDKSVWMVVWSVDEHGVYIVNGREHRIERPKRKNPRHLTETGRRLSESDMETNRTLRRALATAASEQK